MWTVLTKTKYLYLSLALLASLPRLAFIMLFPEMIGDGVTYSNVAKNILSGCGVSISEYGSGECIPHFGGNQGPGYPLYIATIWWLTGNSDFAVLIFQGLFYVISLVYLLDALLKFTSSPKQVALVGIIFAISPLQIAWPRFFFTETLSLACTLWIFAEFIKAIQREHLKILPISLAIVIATFLRLDAILLLVPIGLACFLIHRPITAMKKSLVIFLILSLPWCLWMVRNTAVGLKHVFAPLAAEQNMAAEGLYLWVKTWSTNQYSSAGIFFPTAKLEYDKIQIDKVAFSTEKQEAMVTDLLEELKQYVNQPFPKHIDEQFRRLGYQKIKSNPLNYFVLVPAQRIFNFWWNINAGYGWPGLGGKLSPKERIEIVTGDLKSKFSLLKKYPTIIIGKIVVNLWKLLLYALFLVAIWLTLKGKEVNDKTLLTLAFSFILARSLFTGWLFHAETRYSVMQLPIVELVTILVISKSLVSWQSIKKT